MNSNLKITMMNMLLTQLSITLIQMIINSIIITIHLTNILYSKQIRIISDTQINLLDKNTCSRTCNSNRRCICQINSINTWIIIMILVLRINQENKFKIEIQIKIMKTQKKLCIIYIKGQEEEECSVEIKVTLIIFHQEFQITLKITIT